MAVHLAVHVRPCRHIRYHDHLYMSTWNPWKSFSSSARRSPWIPTITDRTGHLSRSQMVRTSFSNRKVDWSWRLTLSSAAAQGFGFGGGT